VQFPTDTDTARLCCNQLVQLPPGYFNFDFGAILVVTFVGILFFAVGMLFERAAKWYITKRRGERGLKEWKEDGQFQLLKRMYDAQNVAGWVNPDDEIPITMRDLQPVPTGQGAGNRRNAGLAASAQVQIR
jgi:hypothetical protein